MEVGVNGRLDEVARLDGVASLYVTGRSSGDAPR